MPAKAALGAQFTVCGPSAPPPPGGSSSSSSGGIYIEDQAITAGDGDCEGCTSAGAVAGISIATFAIGFIIGAAGLTVPSEKIHKRLQCDRELHRDSSASTDCASVGGRCACDVLLSDTCVVGRG